MRWALFAVVLCAAAWASFHLRSAKSPSPPPMLGGFGKVDPAANDAGVERARSAVAEKLSAKLGGPVSLVILEAQSQVVAGTNYRLKLKADTKSSAKYYQAQVWAKLPAHGGAFEVTHLDEISADQAGDPATKESPGDMDVEDAAAYAVQQLSQQSNSLFPYELKEIMSATLAPGSNGDGGGTHTLRLRVARGSQPDELFEVEVEMDNNAHRLKSSKQLLSG